MSNWMIFQIIVEIALLVFGLTGLFFAFRELQEAWNCDKYDKVDDIPSLHPITFYGGDHFGEKYTELFEKELERRKNERLQSN